MATATVTLTQPPMASMSLSPPCSNCGSPTSLSHPSADELNRAQQRIAELESQVEVLTLRATSAVEKANEYEGELRRLSNARNSPASPRIDSPSNPNVPETLPPPSSPPRTTAGRLVRLLSTRRDKVPSPLQTGSSIASTPLFSPGPVVSSPLSEPDTALRDALTQEQTLRKEAESQAARKDSEIEELSAKLFEEANEMVAVERRARAKLETRVETLEKRDTDKGRRLDILEQRVHRSERVRALLQDTHKGNESEDSASIQSDPQ